MICIDQQATLQHLNSLKPPSGKEVKIIANLAPYWKYFGVHLDFDETGRTLDLIDRDNQYNSRDCCKKMMEDWLSGQGRQPATWTTLIEMLKEAKYNILAMDLEEVVLSLKDGGKVTEEVER